MQKAQSGFTFIEIMLVLLVIAIISAIAFPSYQEAVDTGCMTTGETNMLTLVSSEENFYEDTGTYHAGIRTVDGDGNVTADTLSNRLHWRINDANSYNYKVVAGTGGLTQSAVVTVTQDGCADTATYTMTQ